MLKERIRAERSDRGKPRKKFKGITFNDTTEVQNMPANRRWEIRNKKKDIEFRREQHYRENLKKKFNLSHEEYLQKLYDQNGVCAICDKPETTTKLGVVRRLAVDHNHETGQIRGLLCTRCNAALGFMYEDIEILESMISYLREYGEE